MQRTIPFITDIDDVVLNWIDAFRPHAQKSLKRAICPKGPDSWNLAAWLGVEDALPYINAFNASPQFGNLNPFDCARRVLPAIAQAGHPICVITAVSDHPGITQLRIQNLHAIFGDIFHSIDFVPLGGSKAPHLQRIHTTFGGPGIWVEDNYKNARAGADIGHTTFVVRRPGNRHHEAACTDKRLTWIDDTLPVAAHMGVPLAA